MLLLLLLAKNMSLQSVKNALNHHKSECQHGKDKLSSDEINKIQKVGMFSTNVETNQKEFIEEVYDDATFGSTDRSEHEFYGFSKFKQDSGDFSETGFSNLNFSEDSGFFAKRNEIDTFKIDVHSNNFSKVHVGSKTLQSKYADTLHIKGSEGISVTASVDKVDDNTLTFRNRFTSVKSMKDVDAPNPKENDILVRKDGKFRSMSLNDVAEIAPSVIYGGEF